MSRGARKLWKPLIQKAVTGRWRRFRMKPCEPPFPTALRRAGLYLHVPFCEKLCPYCPYNRVLYSEDAFARYEKAVCQEIDLYAPHLEKTELVSFYIGGGTPTVNREGLLRILRHIRSAVSLACDISIELHPAHMDDRCLSALREAGVSMISIGVESTSDTLLGKIGRSHDGETALDSLRRARRAGFESINADLMFALPGQTLRDWEKDLQAVLGEGIDQLSTYPMFSFPYTELGLEEDIKAIQRPQGTLIRSMLRLTDRYAARHGLTRCAVWSWLRPSRHKFSSISRHHYIGLGPSAASMTGSHFYVNTFDVEAYARTLPARRPIALSIEIDRRLEMAYWLYWRVYELHVENSDFQRLFDKSGTVSSTFGKLFRLFQLLGMVEKKNADYLITSSGAYWIHRLQNEFSLNYINRLWGRCRQSPWPQPVAL